MGVTDDFAPSFTQKPQLRQEDDGNKLVFECQLLASPKPEISWYRSDELLKEDNRTQFKIQTIANNKFLVVLELDDVIETDAGLYKVKAKNKMGEVAASINLNFSPADEEKQKQVDGKAPTFARKPAIRQEDDGKRLIFECRIEAEPVPTVAWFHNTGEVTPGPRHKLSISKDGKSYHASLEINNVTVEDAGKYRVTAKNELGESNATISLNFDSGDDENGFAPSFVEKPRIIPNEDGTLITMRCVCKAKPAAEVKWYRGTTLIKASSKIEIKSSVISEDVYELILLLSNPTAADGGAYRCHVQNEFGESNANLNLNIEAEPEPEGEGPTFVEKPTIQSKENGKLVIMGCKVKASPRPTIVWYHEGKEIRDSSKIKTRVEVKEDVYTIVLELVDPGIEDSGLYKCNIKNELGELNANLTLNIEIIPVIKEKPKIIKIVKKKTVIVECKVLSKFAPSCTWFKESSAVKEDSRHTVLIEPVREGEFAVKLEISNVSQQDKGSYKLVAKNEKGEAVSQQVEVTDIPEEKGDKPQIIKHLRSLAKKENEEAEFVAVLKTSDQSCRCTWYKNSTVIRESSDINTSFDGTNARLIIRKVSSKYVANYRVVIKNEFGEDESSADLTIVEEKKKKKEEEEEETTVIEESEEEMSIVEEKSIIEENHIEEKRPEKRKQQEEEESIVEEKKTTAKKVSKKEEVKMEANKEEVKVEAKKTEAKVEAKKVETKVQEQKKTEAEIEEAKKILEKKTAKTEEEKKALLEKIEKKKTEKAPEAEPKIEGIPKLKPVKPKEEPKPVEEKKDTKKSEEKKKVVKKKVVSKKKEADEELEFIDDYERPVLEKYERITPTPLEKRQRVSDTPKTKRASLAESVESQPEESEEEPSVATPVPDKKSKVETEEKVKEETKRTSIKKGIPKPEEPVDELTQIKLSKTPLKPETEIPEEPQVAQSKKPVKKPDEQKEFVDDYERPDLEKYEKVTPTPSDRTKKQNGVREESPEFVDDYEKPELEKYEKISPTPKDKRRPSDTQDETDMMKGKIKPKPKEDEPEMPTLRKRSVAKDKEEEKKPDEKPKPKSVKKDETKPKKRPSIKEKEVEEEFIDDYERPVLEKYEKISPTPLEKKKKEDKKPDEQTSSVTAQRRRSVKDKDKPEPMEVDEVVSVEKPKTPVKPGQMPEDVSLTHKTPAEIKPTEGEAEAKLKIKKPEIVEDKTIKRPTPKDKDEKTQVEDTEESVSLTKPRTKTSTTAPEEASLTQKKPAQKKPTEGSEAAELKVKKPAVVKKPKNEYELDFIDDYERPVLEKYEKISPTPLVKEKKEKEMTKTDSRRTSVQSETESRRESIQNEVQEVKTESRRSSIIENKSFKFTKETSDSRKSSVASISEQEQVSQFKKSALKTKVVKEPEVVNELEQIKLKDDTKPTEDTVRQNSDETNKENVYPWRPTKTDTQDVKEKTQPKRSLSLDQPKPKDDQPLRRRHSKTEDIDETEFENIEKSKIRRKISIDRPTEPTYPWRPPKVDEDSETSMEVDDVESVDKSKTSEPTPKPAYTTTPKSKEDLQSDKVDKEETPKTDKDDKVVTEQESPYPWRRPSKPKEEPEKINDTFNKPNDQIAKDKVTDSVKDKDTTKDAEKLQTLHPWAKTKEVPILITPEPENEKEVPFSWQVIPEIPQAEQTPELEDKYKPTLKEPHDTTVPWRRSRSPQAESESTNEKKPASLEIPQPAISSRPQPDEV